VIKPEDINKENRYNRTMLMEAIRLKAPMEILHALVQRGADVNHKESMYGYTPLMLASTPEHITFLLENGAKIDEIDNRWGNTALIHAVKEGRIAAVQTLLDYKAKIDLQNNKGETALILASKLDINRVPMVRLLLERGAEYNLRDKEGYTVWDYVDEQTEKRDWVIKHFGDSNPYESLPKMNIYTYDLANIISSDKYDDIEDTAFNFKEFFRVWKGDPLLDKKELYDKSKIDTFIHEKDIIRFLDLLVESGEHNYPFSTVQYRDNFKHTLWMLPGVKEARALSNLLKSHRIFQHFSIVNVAGVGDEEVKSDDAIKLVKKAIRKIVRNKGNREIRILGLDINLIDDMSHQMNRGLGR
jgi:hypothetical protein